MGTCPIVTGGEGGPSDLSLCPYAHVERELLVVIEMLTSFYCLFIASMSSFVVPTPYDSPGGFLKVFPLLIVNGSGSVSVFWEL
jgi:hypothetical protein